MLADVKIIMLLAISAMINWLMVNTAKVIRMMIIIAECSMATADIFKNISR